MNTADPTAPATPGEALRWAAERITARLIVSPDIAAQAVVAWLNVWARDLDPAPATPPELYAVLVPASTSPFVDFCADATEATSRAAELAAEEHSGFRAYRLVPLSTTPPAGTEPASATAVDPPAGMQL